VLCVGRIKADQGRAANVYLIAFPFSFVLFRSELSCLCVNRDIYRQYVYFQSVCFMFSVHLLPKHKMHITYKLNCESVYLDIIQS